MSKNKETTQTNPAQISLKTTTQYTIMGLLSQKQTLERNISVLEEAFQEVIIPLCPNGDVGKYRLANDEKTGVLFLELKPEATETPERNITPFPTEG